MSAVSLEEIKLIHSLQAYEATLLFPFPTLMLSACRSTVVLLSMCKKKT